MNIWRIVSTGLLFSFVLSSCKNDPYPADALFEPIGQKVEKSQSNVLFLQAPGIMRFEEGEENIYQIEGITPSGKALIEAPNLPKGATFDSTTNELKWTPGFSDADNFGNTKSEYREYEVKFKLYDADNTLYFVEKESILIVFDKPQELIILTDEKSEFKEGEKHSQDIKFEYADGSKAKATAVYSHDLPEGAKINSRYSWRRRGYSIDFVAPVNFVRASYTLKDSKGYYRDIGFNINVIDQKGRRFEKAVNWRVYDQNRGIDVFAPKKIKAEQEVFFTVIAVDKNGEYTPSVDVIETVPVTRPTRFGEKGFYISRMVFPRYSQKGERWAYYGVTWKNIPKDIVGSHDLKFKACGRVKQCKEFSVTVDLSSRRVLPAVFVPSENEAGETATETTDTVVETGGTVTEITDTITEAEEEKLQD